MGLRAKTTRFRTCGFCIDCLSENVGVAVILYCYGLVAAQHVGCRPAFRTAFGCVPFSVFSPGKDSPGRVVSAGFKPEQGPETADIEMSDAGRASARPRFIGGFCCCFPGMGGYDWPTNTEDGAVHNNSVVPAAGWLRESSCAVRLRTCLPGSRANGVRRSAGPG